MKIVEVWAPKDIGEALERIEELEAQVKQLQRRITEMQVGVRATIRALAEPGREGEG